MPSFVSNYWPQLLPSALGLAAIYLLLPRARRFPPVYGAVAAALALFAAGRLLIGIEEILVETILFYVFAGLAITFGGLMITQRDAVHAALSFAMVVLSTCGLFLLQAAPFLMAATIIIYAGAIVVTFLFVIMLAQQAGQSSADLRSREPFLASVAGFVLLAALLSLLQKSYNGPDLGKLDGLMERAHHAANAHTLNEWEQILGSDDSFFLEFRRFVLPPEEHRRADVRRRALGDAIENGQLTWNTLLPPGDGQPRGFLPPDILQHFQEDLEKIYQLAALVRQNHGSLVPADQLQLSDMAGSPPNVPPELSRDGKPVERLPAANVAGLGKALFTDYLLAVELAGTLLLVAVIGAIAIAGRRAEGLR
jgi:NADH-quinone oxidoreductase subunit J